MNAITIVIVKLAVILLPIFGYMFGYINGREKGFDSGIKETTNLYEKVYGFKKGEANEGSSPE